MDEVDGRIHMDETYQTKYRILLRKERDYEYVDALYWAAKSKDKKLDALSKNLTPEDMEKEVVEGTVNSIMIKLVKNSLTQKNK